MFDINGTKTYPRYSEVHQSGQWDYHFCSIRYSTKHNEFKFRKKPNFNGQWRRSSALDVSAEPEAFPIIRSQWLRVEALVGLPLEYLNVSKNSLTAMVNIDDIKGTVININFQDNQINNTDDGTFNNLTQLKILNLGNNHLENLTLGNLPILQFVNVRKNRLTHMPILMSELPGLLSLQLDLNQIRFCIRRVLC